MIFLLGSYYQATIFYQPVFPSAAEMIPTVGISVIKLG
jgi:hypothetical protein